MRSKILNTTLKFPKRRAFQSSPISTMGRLEEQRPANIPICMEPLSPDSSQEDIANTLRSYHASQSPVLLQGPLSKNDAIQSWTSLDYLESAVGEQTPCHVETLGGSYTENGERLDIKFGGYIHFMKLYEEKYGALSSNNMDGNDRSPPEKEELLYLAQNELFEGLYGDFILPKLCQDASYNVGEGGLYNMMLWFGPKGCQSPLHYDLLDNLLMQFVGRKRALLFPRSVGTITDRILDDESQKESNWYYAGYDGQQYNTSPIDLLDPDFQQFPNFLNAPPAIECYLNPGDILYIPSKWWHQVTSLDTAISVNAWWR